MPLQGLTASIVNDRRYRRHQLDAVTNHPVTDDDERAVFDRTTPSRSHTIRSDGQRRQVKVMPRSQSTGRIDSLLESSNDSATIFDSPETGNRLRRRLDVIRSNLVARVVRKRSRGAKDYISRHQKGDEVAPVPGESEVPDAVHQPRTVWNDADTSSVSSPSSPTTTMFDRRRVHRRTPRRHRTVIDGQQVETARGLLRRQASQAPEALGPVVSDVLLRQSSSDTGEANSNISSVSSNINIRRDNDSQQLQAEETSTREEDIDSSSPSIVVFETVLDRLHDRTRKLGFTVVGGSNSPRGPMGIYIKTIFPGGLADESKLREGDEVVSVNGTEMSRLTHSEAVAVFKATKLTGQALVLIRRRTTSQVTPDNNSSIADESASTRTSSAVSVDASTKSNVAQDDDVVRSVSTDGGSTLNDRRCRSLPAPRPWKDLNPARRPQQRDVYSLPVSLGHVTPPPSWVDRSNAIRSHSALPSLYTRQMPLRRPEVTSFSDRRIHVGMTSCSYACDEVFEESPQDTASNGRQVSDVAEENILTAACTVNMTSFPVSTKLSRDDVISRPGDKTPKRRHTLALDMSVGSVVQHSPTKPLTCRRKSTSCCELSKAAAVPATDSGNRMSSAMSTSAQRPAPRVQLGQKYAVACQRTESATSFLLVDCGTGGSSSRDGEKSRDFNANDEGKRSKLSAAAWLSSGRSSENVIIDDELFVDSITDDVIMQPPSSSSRRHERQMIFV